MSPEEKTALDREINVQKTLKHDHIVKLYTAFKMNDFLYIILEYVEKGTLFDFIQARTLSENDIITIFYQVTSAINYLHKQKLLHRDIKPENILMKNKGHSLLCDFGFSAPYGKGVVRQTMCGTTEYLPPEIIGREDQNEKVDIWCLGVLLYEMTHNKTPFEGKNIQMLQFQQKKHNIQFNPNINPQLRAIIEKSLEFDAHKRPTAEEILSFPIFSKFKSETANGTRPIVQNETNRGIAENNRTEINRAPEQNVIQYSKSQNPQMHNGYTQQQYFKPQNIQTQTIYQTPMPQSNQQTHNQQNIQTQFKQQPQVYTQTDKMLPLKTDASPKRILFQNAIFKKKQGPEAETQQPVSKEMKYSVTNVTREVREFNGQRSTSQNNNIPGVITNNNGTSNETIRIVQTIQNDEKQQHQPNLYKQFANAYNTPKGNIYVQNPMTIQQGPKMANNFYRNAQDANKTTSGFYRNVDGRPISSHLNTNQYAPKEFKYSYNKLAPEKIVEPKMSYHPSSNGFTYNYVSNNSGVKRVVDPEYIRYNGQNKGNQPLMQGSVTDKTRSKSQNYNIPSNRMITKIIRHG